ncbi:MAG: magnesium transporter CorA family protein [Acidimicrobiia bacterium]
MIDIFKWDEQGTRLEVDDRDPMSIGEGEWIWIDVVDEDEATIRSIGERFALDKGAVAETLGTSELPYIEEQLDQIFAVLYGFKAETGENLHIPEVDMFLSSSFVITFRDGTGSATEQVKDRLNNDPVIPVSTPAGLFALTALNVARQYSPIIAELAKAIDSLEELAIQGDPQVVVEVHALRRDVIYLRRVIFPQFEVFEDLSESTHPVIDLEAQQLFARVASQHSRSLEAIEAGRALLASVIETYRGAVADQTNEIMRVLTVFSAIMLPLGLIAGIWGTNFNEIPGSGLPWGFFGLLGLMITFAVGVWIYFARRGFIGAPRLRELPKAVGLGLFTIGAAPIKAVAGGIKHLGKTEEKVD